MVLRLRQWAAIAFILFFIFLVKPVYWSFKGFHLGTRTQGQSSPQASIRWRELPQHHPVHSFAPLPTGSVVSIPKIQAAFDAESVQEQTIRKQRAEAVKRVFQHSWSGYTNNAWRQDEVRPLNGGYRNAFGGWGATLVDSLDSLWIMGLHDEFKTAVAAVRKIDFSSTPMEELNTFETTIRYLGGLLSAYDLSGQKYKTLLDKAVQLGDMLYAAFDTPNRMPMTRWNWTNTLHGGTQQGVRQALLSEVGSFSLEFTRLSQVTGDPKWYDAIARISNIFSAQQRQTKIPGLWPMVVDLRNAEFHLDGIFSLAGQADSFYEYIAKEYVLLGGWDDQYRDMYLEMLPAAKEHLFFHVMNPQNKTMLMSGTTRRHPLVSPHIIPEMQHLTCFAGGMVALGARIFDQPKELETARQLVEGCIWAYEAMPSSIMPESFHAVPCEGESCGWNETKWVDAVALSAKKGSQPLMTYPDALKHIDQVRLQPGITRFVDTAYYLRPEAIESIFILYRITGDKELQEEAWKMFTAITRATKTNIAYASLADVRESAVGRRMTHTDEMQSFWTAETLKYFYLMFSEPDLISLDDYVFNTEAHPFLRPQ